MPVWPPFLWGAATSAQQVEGGNDANDWYDWERAPGSPVAEPAGAACDHVNRYGEDVALLERIGLSCYRFSVEWSRVEPAEGKFSARWLRHYRDMAKCCRRRGLAPMLTMHHFTNPQWVAADGGWEAPGTAARFERFCARVAEEIADVIAVAITINEPNIPALLGYENGVFPPGKRDRGARLRVTETFI
jgi:beta-glucosidase